MSVSFAHFNKILVSIALFTVMAAAAPYVQEPTDREKTNLDIGWKYLQGDQAGAEAATFDDAAWTTVSLPHTFNYTTQDNTGYYRGKGWYRKHLQLPVDYVNKRFTLYFEGAMTVADVWINGTRLATHFGGFDPFCYDITDHLHFDGTDNIVAVCVDNSYQTLVPPEKPDGSEIDFYLNGGLYRDVWLIATNAGMYIPEPIHAWNRNWTEQGGHRITHQSVTSASATVRVETWVKNTGAVARNCRLVSVIVDSTGVSIATAETPQSITAGGVTRFVQDLAVTSPHLWFPWAPYLYTVYSTVYDGDNALDVYTTVTGIRNVVFTQDQGCFVNDQPFKILGLNRHQTWPFVGHAVPNIQQRRDAERIKEAGCNFVRCSHYLQDDAFFDACDRQGILLWVEIPGWHCCNNGGLPSHDSTWVSRHSDAVRSHIRTARNHASVAIWGPAINEATSDPSIEIPLNNLAHEEDSSRPTSAGRLTTPTTNIYDIYGHNNFQGPLVPYMNLDPASLGYLNTEHTGHTYPTKRFDPELKLIGQGMRHELMTIYARQSPKIHGGIGWCAYDYATPWSGPMAYHGVMDIMRIPKFAYYFYQSQSAGDNYDGSKHPMAFIANHNTLTSPLDRRVYSNCDSVRLYQNGTLIATQRPDSVFLVTDSILCYDAGWAMFCYPLPIQEANILAHPAFTFKNIPFQAGELKAEGLINGQVVATHTVRTPDSAKSIVLQADPPVIEANGSDFSRIVAYVVDSNGTQVLITGTAITFSIASGGGKLLGDNPAPTEAGATIVLAQSSLTAGAMSITASADGLASGTVGVTMTDPGVPVRRLAPKTIIRFAHSVAVKKVVGARFAVPGAAAGQGRLVSVYDLQGKLLYRAVIKKRILDLRHQFGAATEVMVVKSQHIP
jgi:hypothetical protein